MNPLHDGKLRRIVHAEPREVPVGTPARFRGKRVRRCPTEGCSILKIAVASFLILSVVLMAVRIGISYHYNHVKPARPPANHFATSLSPYVIPGYRALPHGRAACQLTTPPISERQCRLKALQEERILNSSLAHHKLSLEDLQERNDKSVAISNGVQVGMRPLRLANYRKALERAEKEIAQRPAPFKNPERTITLLKTLNIILCEGLPVDGEAGLHRQEWNAVSELTGPRFKERVIQKIKEVGSARDVEILQDSFPKFENGFHKGLSRLNEAELVVFKKIMTICPPPEEIPHQMQKFAFTLKKMAEESSSLDLACYAHCELGRIHPFPDGHGRLGRILLLAILKWGGVQNGELVFSNLNEYGKASIDEMKQQGIFKQYVLKALGWTKVHRQDLDLVVNQA